MFQDEGRFGTLTSLGREWHAKGENFTVKIKQGRKSMYSYAAVSPKTGDMVMSNHEKSNTEAMSDFLQNIVASFKEKPILLIMDRAAWHTTAKLIVPKTISILLLPPTSPQLNPVEHLWKHIRTEKFHNVIFDAIEDVYQAVNEAILELTKDALKTLCSCSYL